MKKQDKKVLAEAADAGGPPVELKELIEQSNVGEQLAGGCNQGAGSDRDATDGGSVPPHLVAEIESSMPGESPMGGHAQDVESASDAGECPEALIASIEMYSSADIEDDDDSE